jgi:hypothetical protein
MASITIKNICDLFLIFLQVSKNLLKNRSDCRNAFFHSDPDSLRVNTKIKMDELVAHSRHFLPGYIRIYIANTIRDVFYCLADDLDRANNSIEGFFGCFLVCILRK